VTILTAISAAVTRLGLLQEKVEMVYGSTERTMVDMADLANEVAADIVDGHDWRDLTKVATVTGTGALEYDLPADYGRMVLASEIDDAATLFWGYQPFQDVNDWMRFKTGTYAVISPGGWIFLGGKLQFYPAPLGVAEYPYISNQWARAADGSPKPAFTLDNDTFALDERLLTLGLIWRYQDQKGYPYTESMATYETALARAQSRDKGARLLRAPQRMAVTGSVAYTGRPIR
jgi:hypothetical protein